MNRATRKIAFIIAVLFTTPVIAQDNNVDRDILVTFDNEGARSQSTAAAAPYRNRKRYSIAAAARRNADSVREQYGLLEVDHWPIRSLSVYCFVYRVPPGEDRDAVIAMLRSDERIESVQALQEFETSTDIVENYDDTYANLQHGLAILEISAAHRISRGKGVRVAIVDSLADADHEDLEGRLERIEVFSKRREMADADHGTAIASVIGANANNAKGIVGIAPEASLELFAACWADDQSSKALCDSFTLAKALDKVLENPPQILNMSLTGPFDPLLVRLLQSAAAQGVVIVAARPTTPTDRNRFPSSLDFVIGVANSEQRDDASNASGDIFAPGMQIMVAVPNNAYDFRSGSSLAAAHVSGAIALLFAVSPEITFDSVVSLLQKSQFAEIRDTVSINACMALQLASPDRPCRLSADSSD
ncbi:MAG: S8 family serine peptidase [Woeseiaceae bacterium]|nr:S8 family serine peptidase [Woeseiaceae bacterium]